MRQIDSHLPDKVKRYFGNVSVAESDGFPVKTFKDLVEISASISYLNKDYLIFYRGQNTDYKNKAGRSTFYPTIYRGDPLRRKEIDYRFGVLNDSCRVLKAKFQENEVEGFHELKRKKLIQWSVLQHYEVCDTPLMDFTQSLRVAASFAQLNSEKKESYLYAFGLPYMTNRIASNSEHDLVNVRLLSICPPLALRPYYQEGYLAGTEDIESEYDDKTELDFNRRLIAKFRIPNSKAFWGDEFSPIPESALYPDKDKIKKLCEEIRLEVNDELESGDIGEFLKEWSKVERYIMARARDFSSVPHLASAIRTLRKQSVFDELLLKKVDSIRRFRNNLVHSPNEVSAKLLHHHMENIEDVLNELLL
ncbi:MAG TPA: FRG domain-containing protein [Leucothrix mucor]|uniref:FRG domain-containing protein n=1 Tax=Leucothrix mucor TaxID=45248 RepID=A0A7V2T430_LEUMU|nr:FRG domain-containing protein [Leucothrix mucor]